MQQKEIKYTGITTIPSDYDCPDGDIASMINLVNENGNLVPVTPPEILFVLDNNQNVLYIHKTSDYCNYIVYDTQEGEKSGKICFFTDDVTNLKDITTISNRELYQINSIGNTLVILTNEGMIYALYKSGTYVLMGSNPVFPSLSFRLRASMGNSDMLYASFPGFSMGGTMGQYFLSLEASQAVRDTVLAYTNQYTANAKTAGLFQYPFMIRYAYRMYDGTLNYISSPVKIYPSYGMPYLIHYTGYEANNGLYTKFNMVVSYVVSKLYYEITNIDEVKESISEWGELVKSIDIFITPPLYTVDQDNMCKSISTYGFLGPLGGSGAFLEYCANSGNENVNGKLIYRLHNARESIGTDSLFFGMSGKSLVDNDSSLPFYLISSIDIKKIQSGENIVSIENGALNSLEAKEAMEGDSNLTGTIVAKYAFPYNARLNLTGVTIIPPAFPIESSFQYVNGVYDDNIKKAVEKTYSYKAYIFIEAEKRKVMVHFLSSIPMNIVDSYFFYPNINATELIIERIDENGTKSYSYSKLHKHETLNGVYGSINTSFSSKPDMSLITDTEIGIPYLNKIYTSEVNNPFSFPPTGVNVICSGEILGIRSATKALSQGQFGQFPLYAFTDEGIWALEVSSEGKYISKQPATRDVCNNPESITQIDTAVLFTSERGIMLIQGSESVCISEILNKKSFDISTLRGYEQLAQMSGLTNAHLTHSNFIEYIKECAMSYDYANQRIIVFNKNHPYAYVFSLRSKTWGMIPSNFNNPINSYPNSYIMTKDNTLINVSNSGNEHSKAVKGIIITRPLKLDSPDLLKTITQSIHRGVFEKGHVKSVLYGSRDCINYVPITSSTDHTIRSIHGSPYKYFRFAIITELLPGESLSGTSIIFETRQTNKLR